MERHALVAPVGGFITDAQLHAEDVAPNRYKRKNAAGRDAFDSVLGGVNGVPTHV